MPDQPFKPVSRETLVQEIALGLRFDSRKELHNAEDIMARITAEKLADHLRRSNFVVMHAASSGPAASAPGALSGEAPR